MHLMRGKIPMQQLPSLSPPTLMQRLPRTCRLNLRHLRVSEPISLSGLGVTSDEQAKNFFAHPLDTVIKSFEAQGQLAKKARDAYDKGDYMGALQHGLIISSHSWASRRTRRENN